MAKKSAPVEESTASQPSFYLPKELQTILMAATVIFAFNVWEHFPGIVPNHYTDIVSIYYRDGVGIGPHGVPYVDYVFEYPALVGVLIYLASLLARWSSTTFGTSIVIYKLIVDFVLYIFTMVTIIVLYRLTARFRVEPKRIWQVFLIMPSFLMFVDYNFDIMAIAFTLLALYLVMFSKHSSSALCLGLGVCAKLYPGVLLPAFLAMLPSWRSRLRYVLITGAVVSGVNLPFMLAGFQTWFGTWTFLAEWGIENSWLIFAFGQLDPLAHYVGLAVFVYLAYKVMIESHRRKMPSDEKLLVRSFLLSLAWLLGSYIVTPQMALILLPFYVLLPTVSIIAAYASDTLNALIIVFWFTEMSLGRNPIAPDNPVQWIALARQLVWLGLFVQGVYPSRLGQWIKGLLRPLAS
jgi:uncharacterized membrane protein